MTRTVSSQRGRFWAGELPFLLSTRPAPRPEGPRWRQGSEVRAAPSGLLLPRRGACFRQRWLWDDSVPKAGPGASVSVLSVIHPRCVSPGSQECPWEQPRPTHLPSHILTVVLSFLECPRQKVFHSRVTASLPPSCTESSEPNSVSGIL